MVRRENCLRVDREKSFLGEIYDFVSRRNGRGIPGIH